MGGMRLGRKRQNRVGASAAAMVALAALIGACSPHLSLNNLTLTPKPDGLPKNSDPSVQPWGRSSSGTVTTADLIGPQGQCPPPPLAPAQSGTMPGQAQAEPLLPGGISLQMTECDVVHRAGPGAKMELDTPGRGERA